MSAPQATPAGIYRGQSVHHLERLHGERGGVASGPGDPHRCL